MEIIKKISKYIDEELCDADKYIRCAMVHKETYPQLSKLLYQLSEEELDHANRLHDVGTTIIGNYSGDVPEAMQKVYDYLHEMQIDKAKEVRMMQSMYKNG